MLCALIMAGGKGERFWPLSTDNKPKQFLNLLGEKTMIQMTVDRIKDLIPIERIFIVTGKKYVELVKEQLPELPEKNIIVEPIGRNTAPCIGLSAFVINKYYGDSTIAVLPSDHLIEDENKFRNTLKNAYNFVEENESSIVTIGMKPSRPETGYGYIQYDKIEQNNAKDFCIKKVERFVEKPNAEKAKEYVDEGNFLWNGGMFIWKTKTILQLTELHLNDTYEILKEIAVSSDEEFEEKLDEKYCMVESISVDYGIMEKAKEIYVIPGEFGWDDVGTWNAVERVRDKDENENVCSENVITIDSSNNIVLSNGKPIVVAGIDNMFIVESDEMIFVGTKHVIDKIKEIKGTVSQV